MVPILLVFFVTNLFGQAENNCDDIKHITISRKPSSLSELLAGVKYAVIRTRSGQATSNDHQVGGSIIERDLKRHLEALGLTVYLDYIPEHKKIDSYTDYIAVGYDTRFRRMFADVSWSRRPAWIYAFHELELTFYSGIGTPDEYNWKVNLNNTSTDQNNSILYAFQQRIHRSRYNEANRIRLPQRITCWTEETIKEDYIKNGMHPIEGIYESAHHPKYRVALKNIKNTFYLIYIDGAENTKDWQEGEIKGKLTPTATNNLFGTEWIMADKSENNDPFISFEQGLFNLTWTDGTEQPYVKMYPTASDNILSHSNISASGTGFALSSDGLIITNHHIVENARTIKVRGVNSDFHRSYNAEILVSDRNNDLAIIQIVDSEFETISEIPYAVNTDLSRVGTSVFVLGYPLMASMGEEIKLTNGIISSNTGFQGDINSYQISVPVQPGNSGGPLFNNGGDLIGIVNAKHVDAENVSYAIKSSYLSNLIELLPETPRMPHNNRLKNKPLSDQAEKIQEFVYIIEISR